MYNMYQIVKPNGDKLAWLEEDEAIESAIRESKKLGKDQIIFNKLECEDDEGEVAGKEYVVYAATYSDGEIINESHDRYEAPSYIPAPSKTKKGKAGLTPEQKAAKEEEKAANKAKRDAEKAQRDEVKAKNKAEREAAAAARKAQRELDKANRPAAGSRSRLPDDGVIHMLRDTNPKRVGSASHPRFDLYKEGMTVKGYKELNKDFGSADLAWDIDHGFIKVTKADGSALDTAVPAPAPTAEPSNGEADGEPVIDGPVDALGQPQAGEEMVTPA